MAFQDYELIHTKRVNRTRHSQNIFNQRNFNAMGGWNTLYFLTIFGVAGHQLRQAFGKLNISHIAELIL
jgi:hypothetical protein